jgi:hypothetical protein
LSLAAVGVVADLIFPLFLVVISGDMHVVAACRNKNIFLYILFIAFSGNMLYDMG